MTEIFFSFNFAQKYSEQIFSQDKFNLGSYCSQKIYENCTSYSAFIFDLLSYTYIFRGYLIVSLLRKTKVLESVSNGSRKSTTKLLNLSTVSGEATMSAASSIRSLISPFHSPVFKFCAPQITISCQLKIKGED